MVVDFVVRLPDADHGHPRLSSYGLKCIHNCQVKGCHITSFPRVLANVMIYIKRIDGKKVGPFSVGAAKPLLHPSKPATVRTHLLQKSQAVRNSPAGSPACSMSASVAFIALACYAYRS